MVCFSRYILDTSSGWTTFHCLNLKYYGNIISYINHIVPIFRYLMNSNSNNNRRKSFDMGADNAVLTAAANRMAVQSTVDATAAHKHHRSRDNIDYNKDLEVLLKDNAEECESLGILHRASYEKYSRLSNYINIPVIILSSAIGFATGIDIGYANMNIILGVGSIFVGIIKSIDTYFQLGKRSESHRLCSLQYQQIHKKIQIELALQREQRQTAKDMLSVIKTDIKNLQDISPLVDQDIINNYNDKYGKYTTVKKPNFVNGLTEVTINDTDEHGKDVLHSRPRSAPISASGSLSGSDDEGGGGGGSGGGSGTSRPNFTSDNLNNHIQIHAFNGSVNNSQMVNANASDVTPMNLNVNANSLNYRDPTSSGVSQYSHNSRRSHVSSLHSQHTPNMVIDELRMPPNITASLVVPPPALNAPSLLNTFENTQRLHNNPQSQNQTPRSGSGNGSGNEICGGFSDNVNMIINVDPGNVYYPDDDNGAM